MADAALRALDLELLRRMGEQSHPNPPPYPPNQSLPTLRPSGTMRLHEFSVPFSRHPEPSFFTALAPAIRVKSCPCFVRSDQFKPCDFTPRSFRRGISL